MAKPRKQQPLAWGCPLILWFDYPEMVLHYLGRSVKTLLRWEPRGLKIHRVPTGRGEACWVETVEYFDFLHAAEARGEAWLSAEKEAA